MRAEMPGNIAGRAMADYYAWRATHGGFLITEATYLTRPGNRGLGSPGIEAAAARAKMAGFDGILILGAMAI